MKYYLIMTFFLTSVKCLERKMFHQQNPNCSEKHSFSVYYTKAEGPIDTLHYVWDFSRRPTMFIALTSRLSYINFDCDKFEKNANRSFYFTSGPFYTFALVINKIIEFNDIHDDGFLTPTSPNTTFDTEQFKWKASKNFQGDSKVVSLEMKSSNYVDGNANWFNGSIFLQLTTFGTENHDDELPRLVHSPNSTQCTIRLDKVVTSSGFNNSRFAIELILVSSDNKNSSCIIHSRKSLDDENSPGVFSMVDVMTPQAQDGLYKGAFLQWRPIVYTAEVPTIGNSTELVTYELDTVFDPEDRLKDTLAYEFYGPELNYSLVQRTVVSLGSKEDGFYKETNYSSWTFLISYGGPQDEKFSLLIIMVISIGLGLPAILIFVGGTYMCARRLSRNKDELCLER